MKIDLQFRVFLRALPIPATGFNCRLHLILLYCILCIVAAVCVKLNYLIFVIALYSVSVGVNSRRPSVDSDFE